MLVIMLGAFGQPEAVPVQKIEKLLFEAAVAKCLQSGEVLSARDFDRRRHHRAGHNLFQQVFNEVPVQGFVIGLIKVAE